MTSEPVTITVTEFGGDRTLSWTRADRADLDDAGTWTGSLDWVTAARSALATRTPVLVALPDLYYEFEPFDGTVPVHNVAAAIIAAAGDRGDCTAAFDELPDDLFDASDVPEGAIY